MSEWQPIATAPKDESFIIVFARWGWDYYYAPTGGPYQAIASFDKDSGRFIQTTENPYEDYSTDATHWMPLPKPPTD